MRGVTIRSVQIERKPSAAIQVAACRSTNARDRPGNVRAPPPVLWRRATNGVTGKSTGRSYMRGSSALLYTFGHCSALLSFACMLGLTAGCDRSSNRAKDPSVVESLGLEFVLLPGGEFMMGSWSGAAPTAELRELERRRVAAVERPFLISACEVTNTQFQMFVRKTGYDGGNDASDFLRHEWDKNIHDAFRNADAPVVFVSWRDANAFCVWLTENDGRVFRLPSTVEWEYACRAGGSERFCFGDAAMELCEYAWYKENASGYCHVVGTRKPNAWGIHDMHGNVSEWCSDFMPQKYLQDTPYARKECAKIRGGCYRSSSGSCRCAAAWACEPVDSRTSTIGFRVVCEVRKEAGAE